MNATVVQCKSVWTVLTVQTVQTVKKCLRGANPISDGILFHLLCHPRFGLNYIFCVKPDVQITKDFNSHSDKYKLYSLTVVFSIAIIRAYLQLFLQGCSSKAILRGALPLDVLPLNCLNFSSARCRLTWGIDLKWYIGSVNNREGRKASNRKRWVPFTYYGKNLQSRVKEISESNFVKYVSS